MKKMLAVVFLLLSFASVALADGGGPIPTVLVPTGPVQAPPSHGA